MMNNRKEIINGVEFTFPSILYKYRCWSNPLHHKILTDNEVYLASPRDFEDVYDCNVPEKYPSKDQLFDYFFNIVYAERPQLTRQQKRACARQLVKRSPLAHPKLRKLISERFAQVFHNCFGVLSMTADCNNDEMWRKYGDNHKGFCIGIDTRLLFECVGGGGDVTYEDKLPTIDFFGDDFMTKHFKGIFVKENKWRFEKEYRLHKRWDHVVTNDERNIELPINSIVKIILGNNMPLHDKLEIIRIAKRFHPNAEIIENK